MKIGDAEPAEEGNGPTDDGREGAPNLARTAERLERNPLHLTAVDSSLAGECERREEREAVRRKPFFTRGAIEKAA
jgi:hypothetical protein